MIGQNFVFAWLALFFCAAPALFALRSALTTEDDMLPLVSARSPWEETKNPFVILKANEGQDVVSAGDPLAPVCRNNNRGSQVDFGCSEQKPRCLGDQGAAVARGAGGTRCR